MFSRKEKKLLKSYIDIICPEHGRSSCGDNDLANGFYSNFGYTRCLRCTLLQIIEEGFLPESHSLSGQFSINDKKAEKEEEKRCL